MDHLCVDVLDDACLPFYAVDSQLCQVWSGSWSRPAGPRNGSLVPVEIDGPLTDIVDRELPAALESIKDTPGTFLLSLRTSSSWDNLDGWLDSPTGRIRDRHGVLVLAGFAFFPGLNRLERRSVGPILVPLDVYRLAGASPIPIIEQCCLGIAGKEHDSSHPLVFNSTTEWRVHRTRDKVANQRVLARARSILTSCLDNEQLAEFEQASQFHVHGADGHTYLVINQHSHNVFRIENGQRVIEYCLMADAPVPIHDLMLTQKLLLETDPDLFHARSNWWSEDPDGSWTIKHRAEKQHHWLDGVLGDHGTQERPEDGVQPGGQAREDGEGVAPGGGALCQEAERA